MYECVHVCIGFSVLRAIRKPWETILQSTHAIGVPQSRELSVQSRIRHTSRDFDNASRGLGCVPEVRVDVKMLPEPVVGEPDLRGNFAEQVFSSRLAVTLGHELRKLPPLESLPAYAMGKSFVSF